MDIAHHVIDVVAVDHNLGEACLRKLLHEVGARGGVDVDGNDFVARNHALPYLRVLEVDGVAEDFNFVFHLRSVGVVAVHGLLYEGIYLVHGNVRRGAAFGLDAGHTHQQCRQLGDEHRHRI